MKVECTGYTILWPDHFGAGLDPEWIRKSAALVRAKFAARFGCNPGSEDMTDCKIIKVVIRPAKKRSAR